MAVANDKTLYLRLLRHVRPYTRLFIAGLIATIVTAATQPGVAAMMKPLLDGTFVEKDPELMFWMPIALVGLFFVRGLAAYASELLFAWISSKVVYDLRMQMFERLLSLPAHRYDQQSAGKLISKLTYDVTQVTTGATEVLIILVRDSVQVVGLLAWVFYLDWRLSLVTLGLAPLIAGVAYFVGRRLRGLTHKLQDSFGDMTHVLEESVRGHKVVKLFGGQDYERRRFSHIANWVRRFQMKFRATASASVPIVEMFGAIAMALVIYLGTQRTGADQLTVGGFVSFFGALALLFSPIKRLTKVNEPLQRSLAAASSVFGLVDESPEPAGGEQAIERARGEIRFQDVRFHYGDPSRPALNGLSLTIEPGQNVALVGSSGSGKTTAANLLPRLYEIEAGSIRIDGVDIRELPIDSLRCNISLVSQDVVLFNDTVAANIAYGLRPMPEIDDIRRAAEDAYALDFIEQLEDGFDTLVGDNGVRLSGGQRQRIAIARALLKNAPILILDEATSALDNESERQVQAALDNLRRDRTTLIIAHRLSTIERADRIFVMQDGRVVEQGSHAELLAADGAYAQLHRSASRTDDDGVLP